MSPALIDENGSRHDPTNPSNVTLVRETAAWAEFAFGAGSVIAGRLDVDEHGGGVVDLIVVPVREARANRHVTKTVISLPKALAEIHCAHHDDRTSYGALQSSWAAWTRQHIDPRIERGTPKVQTNREHVHADVIRYVAAACEAELRADWSKKVEAAQAKVAATRAEVQADAAAFAEREAAMEKFEGELEAWRVDLAQFEERHEAEVRQAISEAVEGLRSGIAAFRSGTLLLGEAADGRMIVRLPHLKAAEAVRLKATLRPARRVGLLDLLSDLDQQGAVLGRRGPPL